MRKNREYLYEKLKRYSESDYYPFHMPGHKRRKGLTGANLPYEIDITEISGFDDLHHATGLLRDAQESAAELFHAEETHYLVNGSTAGILSAVLGATRPRGKIVMARNCHKSVYNAVTLNNLTPVYVYPRRWGEDDDKRVSENRCTLNGQIVPGDVERLLNTEANVQAVVVTSPTYDGVISDIKAIAAVVHRRGIPLIVDEAHGAHLGFHPYFPENSNQNGADLVIHSLHKTLPALTQSALLHINGELVDRRSVRRHLHMLQSSSPSYVLMAGIDECVRCLEENQNEIFGTYTELLNKTRKRIGRLRNLRLIDASCCDPSKILISCENLIEKSSKKIKKYTGKDLYDELGAQYHLQMEMAAPDYIIAMTAPGDTVYGMQRLAAALEEIDQKLVKINLNEGKPANISLSGENKAVLTPAAAVRTTSVMPAFSMQEEKTVVSLGWQKCAGRIAVEFAYVYPPGIPLIVPGERISEETAELLVFYETEGFRIEGTQEQGRIEVLING